DSRIPVLSRRLHLRRRCGDPARDHRAARAGTAPGMRAVAGYSLEIAGSAREVLAREAPLDGLLERLRTEPVSRGAWDAAAEVGWFRLLTAEAQGGLAAGPALALADLTGDGVSATPIRSFDLAGRPAHLRLEGAPIRVIVRGDEAGRAIERIDRLSRVARSATLGGIAGAALDMSVAYA